MPMSTTIVPASRALNRSSDNPPSPARAPVRIATEDERPRCVSGMPAYAATATTELTPGTISRKFRRREGPALLRRHDRTETDLRLLAEPLSFLVSPGQ